jgi:hypothetical protein
MAKKGTKASKAIAVMEPIVAELVPDSLVASAARIKPGDDLWGTYRFTDETWQRECWRYFHATPELHYAAEYMGSACSLVRIYVQEIAENGRPGDETTDEEILSLADNLLGGPNQKAEALNAIGGNLMIAGECFIVGRASRGDDPDSWKVVSTTELRRRNGQIWIDYGYGPEQLITGRDIVIRLWNPDKERMRFADSPTRSSMSVLWELEQLDEYERSQIDSRLSGAGVYFIPSEMSTGSTTSEVNTADDVFSAMAEAARASRSGRNTAAGVVPVFIEIPGAYLKDMADKPVRFESELSDKLPTMKESAIRRLANGLSMPPEVLLGMGDATHWSAWHIEESFVTIQIKPLMNRICEGLTTAYLRPLLKAMGKNPKRYQLNFDTAPLTVRPNRLQDTLNLYERDIVGKEQVLIAGDYNPKTDLVTQKESDQKFVREVVLRDPTLFQIPGVQEFLGIEIDTTIPMLPGAEMPGGGDLNAPGAPPPPRPTRSVEQPNTGPPTSSTAPGTPILASGMVSTSAIERLTAVLEAGRRPAVGANVVVALPSAVLSAANVVCRRAFELAGGRMLTRTHRGQFPDVPKKLIHTRLKVNAVQAETHLDGAFDDVADDFAGLDVDLQQMEATLRSYCLEQIAKSQAHDMTLLASVLRRDGLIHA